MSFLRLDELFSTAGLALLQCLSLPSGRRRVTDGKTPTRRAHFPQVAIVSLPHYFTTSCLGTRLEHHYYFCHSRRAAKHKRHQERLDRLIDLYADGQFDRLTLDRKTQKIKKEMRKVANQLERSELEREEIERGHVEQIRAWKKLQELKRMAWGVIWSKGPKGSTFRTDVVCCKLSFNPGMITSPSPDDIFCLVPCHR